MALLCSTPMIMLEKRFAAPSLLPSSSNGQTKRKWAARRGARAAAGLRVQAFFNPFEDQPIIKDALKDPVAFMGGVFAGILRLDLNEEPLKEWITRTVEASGIATEGEIDAEEFRTERGDEPQQIEIE